VEKIFLTRILFRLIVFTPDLIQVVGCFEVKLPQLPQVFTKFYKFRLYWCGWSHELLQFCLVPHGLQEELDVAVALPYTADLFLNGNFCLIGR
jgi:hypothetical protein